MSDRPAPLTALRAFEAAARHLSFARGAAEIGVTPAALSFQIKSLEAHLGQPVFRRLNRAVELTEAGRALAPGLTEGFEALAGAWRAARLVGDARSLTVTAGPAFTAKWLAPRLFGFAQAHPKVELRFTASLRILDFARDEVDVAIRFGQSPDAGLHSVTIIEEWLTPMMAPALARALAEPANLARATLIHQEDVAFVRPPIGWPAWLRAAGLPPAPEGGPRFSQADHAVDAALAGAGVILGRISLTEGHLREGRLVAPYPLALRTDARYRLICPMGAERRPQVAAFIAWILAETGPMAALAEGWTFADGS